MDPAPPTTHVHHDRHGDLVVVAAPSVLADSHDKAMEKEFGSGTWCITLHAHARAMKDMDKGGKARVSGDEFVWVPWSQLTQKEQI